MSRSILMVCLGNICRSPLAEGIMQHHIARIGLPWKADSAGTAAYHVGESPDERSIAVARTHDIDISTQSARQLTASDLEDYDHILTMDSSNYQNALRLDAMGDYASKIELLLNYAHPGENRAVPDPYYEGGFDRVYDMIEEAILAFIDKHTKS